MVAGLGMLLVDWYVHFSDCSQDNVQKAEGATVKYKMLCSAGMRVRPTGARVDADDEPGRGGTRGERLNLFLLAVFFKFTLAVALRKL